MLIFWKFLFSEDQRYYEKDIADPVNNVSDIVPYTPSSEDKAVNYILGTFFILPWLSSMFLNPLLFWYFKETATKASFLFQCLTVTDFLTNLFAPLVYTYMMLSPKIYASSTQVLFDSRTWACFFGCSSQVGSFLLAATRALKIVFPFANVKQRYVKMYLGIYTLFMLINNGIYYVIEELPGDQDLEWKGMILTIGLNLCVWANFAHCCAGLFISVFTVLFLYFSTRFVIRNLCIALDDIYSFLLLVPC